MATTHGTTAIAPTEHQTLSHHRYSTRGADASRMVVDAATLTAFDLLLSIPQVTTTPASPSVAESADARSVESPHSSSSGDEPTKENEEQETEDACYPLTTLLPPFMENRPPQSVIADEPNEKVTAVTVETSKVTTAPSEKTQEAAPSHHLEAAIEPPWEPSPATSLAEVGKPVASFDGPRAEEPTNSSGLEGGKELHEKGAAIATVQPPFAVANRTGVPRRESPSPAEGRKAVETRPIAVGEVVREKGRDLRKRVEERSGQSPLSPISERPSVGRRAERLAEEKREARFTDEHPGGRLEIGASVEERLDEPILSILPVDPIGQYTGSVPEGTTDSIAADAAFLTPPSIDATSTTPISPNPLAAGDSKVIRSSPSEATRSTSIGGIAQAAGAPRLPTSSLPASSATSGGSSLTAHQEQKVLHRVLKGLDQLASGDGQVRLRLHPPELGSLQLTLRVAPQQVAAYIEVEHVAARDILVENLSQLQSRLAEQGITVTEFEVQVADHREATPHGDSGNAFADGFSQGQSPSGERGSRYAEMLRNRIDDGLPGDPLPPEVIRWTRSHGGLDIHG